MSGKVIGIEEHELPGGRGMCIIIENDFKDEVHENVIPNKDIENLTKEEIVNIVKEAELQVWVATFQLMLRYLHLKARI